MRLLLLLSLVLATTLPGCVYVAGDAVGFKAGGSASRPAGPPTTQPVEEPSIKDLIREHL